MKSFAKESEFGIKVCIIYVVVFYFLRLYVF